MLIRLLFRTLDDFFIALHKFSVITIPVKENIILDSNSQYRVAISTRECTCVHVQGFMKILKFHGHLW